MVIRCSLLLLVNIVIVLQLNAQSQPRNLDFEKRDGYGNLSSWVRSNYSIPVWSITQDSVVKFSGQYALRFSRDSNLKKNSDGVIFNTLAIDVPAKEITLVAKVLQVNPADTAGTISCVVSQDLGERKTKVRGHFIIGAKEWSELRWKIPLDSFQWPIHHIRLNIGAKGNAGFWVDDIQILAD